MSDSTTSSLSDPDRQRESKMPSEQQDAAKYSDAQHVTNLLLLVSRLVQQLRKRHPENPVAEQAMDYLRRANLQPSILRGVRQNIGLPAEQSGQHEQNLAYHQRRNDLLMELEGRVLIKWQNKWVISFDDYSDMSSTDLRIIADELDRRNKQ